VRGEPPLDSAILEQAHLWIEVYKEMAAFWDETARRLLLWGDQVTSERARQELHDVDQHLIDARCALLQRRLRLWELRAEEFGKPSGYGAPAIMSSAHARTRMTSGRASDVPASRS
jgi:hypothetical protein